MPTRTAAGILGMDTIFWCSVIRDLHHPLGFQSDLSRKDQANEPSATGGKLSKRTPSEPYFGTLPPGV